MITIEVRISNAPGMDVREALEAITKAASDELDRQFMGRRAEISVEVRVG